MNLVVARNSAVSSYFAGFDAGIDAGWLASAHGGTSRAKSRFWPLDNCNGQADPGTRKPSLGSLKRSNLSDGVKKSWRKSLQSRKYKEHHGKNNYNHSNNYRHFCQCDGVYIGRAIAFYFLNFSPREELPCLLLSPLAARF